MLIHHSYDTRFVYLIERLRKEYGEQMFKLEGIDEETLDINRFSKQFFKKSTTADASIDQNANVSDFTVYTWEKELNKPILKLNALYMLWKSAEKKLGIKRANKLIEAEIKGSIRIHDLHFWKRAYCYASSLTPLIQNGMPFYNKIHIGPVKHFLSFINVSLQYITYISNQIAGAVALPDFFVYADYFIRKDYGNEWYKNEFILEMVKQLFQDWIYSVNFSWRDAQSPFTNLSVMDDFWLHSLFSEHVNPDFSKPDFENIKRVQKLFVEQMLRDLENNPFTFPVMTACLLIDEETKEPKDQEFFEFVAKVSADKGLFNIYLSESVDSLSSCCRLRNSLEKSKEYINSFGSGGLNIGSHRVVTVNLPQIAYESDGDFDTFMKLLNYRLDIVHDILDIHRETMQKIIDEGNAPLYTYRFMDLNNQFSTTGFIGLYEALELLGTNILTEDGQEKAKKIIGLMNDKNTKKTKVDGFIRNVEQVPGESAAYTFAKKDKILFESAKYKIYSNQYIPLINSANLADRIKVQGMFDKDCSGGSILHLNCMELIDKEQAKKLISSCAKCGVIYFAINYNFVQCKNCKKVYVGKIDKSPCHNAEVDKYIRVVGFLTKVVNWSEPRREEYKERTFYEQRNF